MSAYVSTELAQRSVMKLNCLLLLAVPPMRMGAGHFMMISLTSCSQISFFSGKMKSCFVGIRHMKNDGPDLVLLNVDFHYSADIQLLTFLPCHRQ